MDFRNKYSKYKPEITFDIFQKVWDKLIESGYLPFGKYDVEKGFGDFKTLRCHLSTTENHPMEFNCYSVIPELFWVETTVQEILGYDPFVRDDDFVLPEKWYVEVTTENKSTLNDWKVKQEYSISLYHYDYKFISENGGGYTKEYLSKDAVKITFDQFKKHVLKQCVEKGKEVITEYVEALIDVSGYFIKGNIYKVESSQNIKSCRLISNIKSGSESAGTILLVDLSNNNRFKPSTKAAFDAQNQSKQLSEQTANNLSETIDRVRYRAMRTAQTETLDEMFCASIDEVSKSLDNYTSELPTHAIGDGLGFVLHSNLLTVPKSYKSYCRSTRVLASSLRGFNVLILTMQIYNF